MTASYASLGVTPIINVDARMTFLGGSLMPPEVLAAMLAAAETYVDVFELQARAGAHLAAITRNEAAYVCTGAAAGMALCTLAARTGTNLADIARLPLAPDCPSEIIAHRAHRVPYSRAIELAGTTLVEVGDAIRTEPFELEAAFGPRTAGVLYVAGQHLSRAALPLDQVVEIADRFGVPVFVDAAAQLPPVDNLWRFTEQGAAAAIFSGGKDLCGPQSSGLIVGTTDFLAGVVANGAPHQRIARAMKVGKEEIMGLVAAVERYLAIDHEQRYQECGAIVDRWVAGLAHLPGVEATRNEINSAGQPMPRVMLRLHDRDVASLRAAMRGRTPSIAIGRHDSTTCSLTPECLADPAEADTVLTALLDELGGGRS